MWRVILKIVISIFSIFITCFNICYATDAVIESQLQALDLSAFIREGENYTKEIFPDIDVNELLNSALTGEIDNKVFYSGILSILGEEIVSAVVLMRKYINSHSST